MPKRVRIRRLLDPLDNVALQPIAQHGADASCLSKRRIPRPPSEKCTRYLSLVACQSRIAISRLDSGRTAGTTLRVDATARRSVVPYVRVPLPPSVSREALSFASWPWRRYYSGSVPVVAVSVLDEIPEVERVGSVT